MCLSVSFLVQSKIPDDSNKIKSKKIFCSVWQKKLWCAKQTNEDKKKKKKKNSSQI